MDVPVRRTGKRHTFRHQFFFCGLALSGRALKTQGDTVPGQGQSAAAGIINAVRWIEHDIDATPVFIVPQIDRGLTVTVKEIQLFFFRGHGIPIFEAQCDVVVLRIGVDDIQVQDCLLKGLSQAVNADAIL